MCRAKAPSFSALTTLLFRPGQLQKTPPPFKNKQFFVLLFRPGQIEKTLIKKKKKCFLRFRMNLNLEAVSGDDPLMS